MHFAYNLRPMLQCCLAQMRFNCKLLRQLCEFHHVLSYFEYRTPAIYHACETVLDPLNRVLRNFLRRVNVSIQDALLHFNLPPLETRRDIAMLGVLHRAALHLPPKHFWQWAQIDTRDLRRSARTQRNTVRPLLPVVGVSGIKYYTLFIAFVGNFVIPRNI